MSQSSELLQRLEVKFKPDPKRVICLLYNNEKAEVQRITGLINKMSEEEISSFYDGIVDEFSWRHRNLDEILTRHFKEISPNLEQRSSLSEKHEKLFGSYFTKEYSVEAAALFNPSIVLHPDQSGLPADAIRFIMTLRGVGEGHISSVEFMTGIIYEKLKITLDPVSRFASAPDKVERAPGDNSESIVYFDSLSPLSERVIFPVTPDEVNGIEDVRMVRFVDGDDVIYYGTFTAYDGRSIKSKMIETRDFTKFRIFPLHGSEVKDKGMALFPRKINDRYAMISRQDGINLWIMFSDDLTRWNEKKLLRSPERPWQFAKIGNCGSPMEIDEGWLVITHGVGSMRKYVIGACLLDKDDPQKVIARLKEPLITANKEEREGYVPNVVYTSGAMIHKQNLIIPYAMSDAVTGFGIVNIQDLVAKMV